MDVPNGDKYLSQICFFEALGTMFLMIAINWGAIGGNITFAVGFTFQAFVIFLSPVCGTHFNPAVTLAVAIKQSTRTKQSPWSIIAIIISQYIGAVMGVLIVFSAIDWEEEFAKNIAILHPGIGHFHGRVFAAELVGTFIFISLILSVKFQNGARDGVVSCFLVGMCLFGVLTMIGGVSGGCCNMAVGIVQPTFQWLVQQGLAKEGEIAPPFSEFSWLYFMADGFAGVLAGLFSLHIESVAKKLEGNVESLSEEELVAAQERQKRYMERYKQSALELQKLQATHLELMTGKNTDTGRTHLQEA